MKKRSDYKYTAFISYRHVEPDASVAAALHKTIETFKVSKDFYEDGKPPSFRVFRDREELSAKDLSDSIQDALKDSYYLIVISSKRTPLSEWCTREVELFRKLHGDDRILSVLIEGEPWESFSKPMMELKKKVEVDGEIQELPLELLAAELRPKEVQEKNFPGYAELEQEDPPRLKRLTKESLTLLKTEKYRIMAAILGCSYGDLRQRDKERKNRLYLQISAFLSALFLIFGLFMLRAYQKENIARREAIQTSSSMLLNRSQELLDEGDKVKSLLVAKEAMDALDSKMQLYSTLKEQHKSLLSDALYPVSASLRTKIYTDNSLSNLDISPQGDLLAVGLSNDGIGLFDAASGELLEKLPGHSEQVKILSFSPDGKYLLSSGFDHKVLLWDMEKKSVLRTITLTGFPLMTRFSNDGKYIFLASGDNKNIHFIRQELSGEEKTVDTKLDVREVSISQDGEKMLVLFYPREGSYANLYNFETMAWEKDYLEPVDKEERTDIVVLRFARDGKNFYLRSKKKLYKLSLEDGKLLYSVDTSFWDDQSNLLRETKDGTKLFYADNSMLRILDSATGEELGNQLFGEGTITDMQLHEDSDMLALALKSGKIALWKEGSLVDGGVDLKGAIPSQMSFDPEGKRLYVSSRSTKEVLYLDLESRLTTEPIQGQIASISSQGRKVLFYDSKTFFVWDTKSMKKEQEFAKEKLDYLPLYMLDGINHALSDDGKWIALPDYTASDGKREHFLRLFDIDKLEEKRFPLDSGQYEAFFTPDSKKIAVVKQGDRLDFYSLDGQKEPTSIPLIGYVTSISFSSTGDKFALNYSQERAQIISYEDGKVQRDLPGQILYLEGDEALGLNNNSIYRSKGDKIEYTSVNRQAGKVPVHEKDRNLYDKESQRLLMIRNGGEKPVVFLLDGTNGNLLKSFYPALATQSYAAKGFFQGEDRDLVLDQAFYSTTKVENKEEIIYVKPLSLQFHFEEYEKMIEKEKDFLGKRNLSSSERKELGLEE